MSIHTLTQAFASAIVKLSKDIGLAYGSFRITVIPQHTSGLLLLLPKDLHLGATFRLRAHEVPALQLGKLLVFESGKVKLQLGDVLLDVSLGEESQCAQEFFAMSVAGTSAVSMGEVARRVVCTPDIEHLLRSRRCRLDKSQSPFSGSRYCTYATALA